MTAASAVALLLSAIALLPPLSAAPSAPPGRIDNTHLSAGTTGPAARVFPSGTRVVYLGFDYADMSGQVVTASLHDGVGNALFTASRTLNGTGAISVPLDSLVVVERSYDALDADATALVAAVDRALAAVGVPTTRYVHTQTALAHANRMSGAVAALRGLPLPADALTALDAAEAHLDSARTAGLAALGATDDQTALTNLQSMRASGLALLLALRDARAASGTGGHPFPPTVGCQPYLVNVAVDGALRHSLEFAVGDPGTVSDIRLHAARSVLYPAVSGLDTTSVTADLADATCQPVGDTTVVSFTVEPPALAAVAPVTATTHGGSATTLVRALGPVGQAVRVTATSGSAHAAITLRFEQGGVVVPPAPTRVLPPAPPVPSPPTPPPGSARPPCPGGGRDTLCDGTLVVEIYRDDTCNRRFDRAWDRHLSGVPVTIVFPSGFAETVTTSGGGTAYFGGLNLPLGGSLDVYADLPPGDALCYNSYSRPQLDAADFKPNRQARVTFRIE